MKDMHMTITSSEDNAQHFVEHAHVEYGINAVTRLQARVVNELLGGGSVRLLPTVELLHALPAASTSAASPPASGVGAPPAFGALSSESPSFICTKFIHIIIYSKLFNKLTNRFV